MTIRARAWIALLVPAVAWFLFEQGLSALLHADCSRSVIGVGWGVASLAAIATAFRIGWPLRNAEAAALANPWIARIGLAASGVFALAITFQTLAIVMVPPCLR